MPEYANGSELWLLRTYFSDDDTAWTTLAEQARSTRSAVSGAELVLSSDRTRCEQRIHRILARVATRAEANDGLYVAIADRETFAHPDRMLLTIDCSAVPRDAERILTARMSPFRAFRLGIDRQSQDVEHSTESNRISLPHTAPAPVDSGQAEPVDLAAGVRDAIRASLGWKMAMTRDGTCG